MTAPTLAAQRDQFAAEFAARLVVAPEKGRFWRRNWWQLLFLLLPVLRVLRLVRAVRFLRTGRVLSARMQQRWRAFVRGGAPDADGAESWPAYDTRSRSTMVIDHRDAVETLAFRAQLVVQPGDQILGHERNSLFALK